MSALTASTPAAATASTFRRDLSLVLWQVRYEQRTYWRNRAAAVLTFALPLMFLVIFASFYSNDHTGHGAARIPLNVFFVPGILAYGVIATTYVNMAVSTAILRDEGVLKRMQGTPLPRWAYVSARISSTVVIMAMMTVVTLGMGAIFYSVHVRASTLPGLVVILALGTVAFTTLGIGIVNFIRTAEVAPVVTNMTVLPLTFLSGVWFPTSNFPNWLEDLAKLFPIKPLADGLQYAFNPHTTGIGLKTVDAISLAIWSAIGIYLMLRFLRRPQGEVK